MRIERIGTPARFLVPSQKVFKIRDEETGHRLVKTIHDFLIDTYGGFTMASGNINGYFKDSEYDEHREYRVAIPNTEHLARRWTLEDFLAVLCKKLDEECIYLEVGLDALLVYPE